MHVRTLGFSLLLSQGAQSGSIGRLGVEFALLTIVGCQLSIVAIVNLQWIALVDKNEHDDRGCWID